MCFLLRSLLQSNTPVGRREENTLKVSRVAFTRLILFCCLKQLSCACVCVHTCYVHTCYMHTSTCKSQRGHWITWNWSCKWLWASHALEKQYSLWNTESPLLPHLPFLCVPHRQVNSTELECIALDLVLLLTPKFEVVSQNCKSGRRGFVYPPYTFYLSSISHNYRTT